MIEMDADFSHDPCYLPALVAASTEADVVLGSRYLDGISVVNWPLRRILLSWGANQYVRLITGLRVQDATSGYRMYRREALAAMDLGSIVSNGYSFQVEMTYRAALAGCRLVEVPIVFTERRLGCSKMSSGVIWNPCGFHSACVSSSPLAPAPRPLPEPRTAETSPLQKPPELPTIGYRSIPAPLPGSIEGPS